MTQDSPTSLWNTLIAAGNGPDSFIGSAETCVARGDLAKGSILDGRGEELRGRSVVVMTTGQLSTALTLFELDGIAGRIVVCPSESRLDYLPSVIDAAGADAIVSDRTNLPVGSSPIQHFVPRAHTIASQQYERSSPCQSEWITLTSGTMGVPKLVVHTLSSLIGAIPWGAAPATKVVWGTLYDIRRFGGLQVFLRAALSGASLLLSSPTESTGSYLTRAGSLGVTHISGTPSQWRRALMSGSAHSIAPEYVRLSGEIADQGILNHLRQVYPQARIVHAFGSSEAGTVFEVTDGVAGIPAGKIGRGPKVETKVENDTLRVRSSMTASRYLGSDAPPLKDADGFVDTGDVVDLRDGRYYFVGRQDGRINVGGLKVHPEEVEAVLNLHPDVHMSLVRARKNPVTGAIVMADVVLRSPLQAGRRDQRALQNDILLLCHKSLPSHKVPAVIRFVSALAIAESGKMIRRST
jgi:acyl-coenzyme A synthetase/AMP-(fatty) acid ligase